ncbi:hypothetical protein C8F04DRAFT_1181907 [Mycena alexandri]|uniref:Uncharacterized protein n=1 Tax=Mycena alexandri TaxID=1745969 RepID=A0AAD6SZF1_9AGAR|nr:hypothetical protein C8F04DRAFT_1181907 [Mycena alexandri]
MLTLASLSSRGSKPSVPRNRAALFPRNGCQNLSSALTKKYESWPERRQAQIISSCSVHNGVRAKNTVQTTPAETSLEQHLGSLTPVQLRLLQLHLHTRNSASGRQWTSAASTCPGYSQDLDLDLVVLLLRRAARVPPPHHSAAATRHSQCTNGYVEDGHEHKHRHGTRGRGQPDPVVRDGRRHRLYGWDGARKRHPVPRRLGIGFEK